MPCWPAQIADDKPPPYQTRDASPGECGCTRRENCSMPIVPSKSLTGSPRRHSSRRSTRSFEKFSSSWLSGYSLVLKWSYSMGTPTDTPGLIRPPDRMSTVARSSASRSGFSRPSGITAVPSSMRLVRWVAAAMIAIGDEMPGCRCRWRSQTLSKPSASARSIIDSVCFVPGAWIGVIESADGQEP